MAMRESQHTYQQWNTEPAIDPSSRRQPKQEPIIKRRQKTVGLTMLEVLLYGTLVVMIAILLLFVLSLKSDSFDMQAEKTELENAIFVKQGEITELETEVNNLASHERIYEKANELGLTMNTSNIRAVEKND